MTNQLQIEVFKTNLGSTMEAGRLKRLIASRFPGAEISIDLADCDRILRIAAREPITLQEVSCLANSLNVWIKELE